MKKLWITLCFTAFTLSAFARQVKQAPLYDTTADARTDIKKAVALAARQHKNVLLQIGGNWCIWCTRFHNTVAANDTLSKLMKDNYVVVHVNYEKKTDNAPVWKELGFPQRFGFPVFVILDEKGTRIHTQNSAYLEEGKGHSPAKIAEFLEQWSPAAVQGKTLSR